MDHKESSIMLDPPEVALSWLALNSYRTKLAEEIRYSPPSLRRDVSKDQIKDILHLMERLEGASTLLTKFREAVDEMETLDGPEYPPLHTNKN